MLDLLGALEALSSHRMLDRLIRGRSWIGIVAFALIGIVTLQLGLLKLNSGIGRSLERASALQRANSALAIENSELAAGTRVESKAESLGMRLTSVSGLRFHESHARSDIPQAAAALKEAPKPAEPHPETTISSTGGEAESGESAAGGATTAAGGAEAERSSEATHESAATPEASPTPSAGGQSSEAATSATTPASETPTEAGGGTAAPGG